MLWHRKYQGKTRKAQMEIAGQIIELDATKMHVYSVKNVLEYYVFFHLITNLVNI
jgi:hypothetical protein